MNFHCYGNYPLRDHNECDDFFPFREENQSVYDDAHILDRVHVTQSVPNLERARKMG